jgi:[ribosomal protein S18]-alanine N-acetyltransferase
MGESAIPYAATIPGVPFTIRDFQPQDFDMLWRVDQACFPAGISYSRMELKYYIRRPQAFTLVAAGSLAAKKDRSNSRGTGNISDPSPFPGSIAGFLVAEADRGSGHIITIDVVSSVRRSGVGSLLLRSAEDRLRAAGCCSVDLETAVDNISALSFYKRHGYNVTGTWPRYYSNGVDALVLQKQL